MGFLGDLAKGFIRSTVNQVGRDGGKVISNNVYGDKHTTPIRITKHETQNIGYVNNSDNLDRIELLKKGYKEEVLKNNISQYVLISIATLIPLVGIIASIYWIPAGFRNLFKTKTKFYTYGEQNVYKSDRRYSTGSKLVGRETVKVYSSNALPASKNERIIYIAKGIGAFIIVYLSYIYWDYTLQGFRAFIKE